MVFFKLNFPEKNLKASLLQPMAGPWGWSIFWPMGVDPPNFHLPIYA